MINIFEVFYDSGENFKVCVNNGPSAIREALVGCNLDELTSLACKLSISAKDIKELNPDQMTAVIIDRVVAIASRSMAFGDY